MEGSPHGYVNEDWEVLVKDWAPGVLRYIEAKYPWLNGQGEDIVASTLGKAVAEFKKTGVMVQKGWLYEVAKNEVRDLVRHRKVRDKRTDFTSVGWRPPEPERAACSSQELQAVLAAADQFCGINRDIFILKVINELPNREVAAVVARSEKTVEARWTTIRRRLEEVLHLAAT